MKYLRLCSKGSRERGEIYITSCKCSKTTFLSFRTLFIHLSGRGQLKCDGTRVETRFCLSAKWTSPFKLLGASVQSTTDS
jgi:hypothetical protein